MKIVQIHARHTNRPIHGCDFWETRLEVMDGSHVYVFDIDHPMKPDFRLGSPKAAIEAAITFAERTIAQKNVFPQISENMTQRWNDHVKQAHANIKYLRRLSAAHICVPYCESVETFIVDQTGDDEGPSGVWINPPSPEDKLLHAIFNGE